MNKKLRIAIVIDWVDTTLWWSYVSAQKFALWLAGLGHHIIWIASRFSDQSRKKDFAYATLYEVPCSFPLWPQKTCFALPSIRRLRRIFIKERIDIIYSIHPSFIWWQALRIAKRDHIPFVSHSHVRPELLFPWAPRFIQQWIKKIIAYLYMKSDGVISPTTFTQNIFRAFSFHNKQVVISNWVDTDIFPPGKNKPKEWFTLLYMGRLDPEKRISLVIKALYLLKQQDKLPSTFSFVLVWWWSEENVLRTLTREYGLASVVTFVWRVDPASHLQITLYQEASALILPSTHELEGMVVLEAMACGLPLLIADSPTSAATAFIKDNWYLFTSAEDLANKLLTMIYSKEQCIDMWKTSLEQSKNFSFTLSVQKLEWFLFSLVEK